MTEELYGKLVALRDAASTLNRATDAAAAAVAAVEDFLAALGIGLSTQTRTFAGDPRPRVAGEEERRVFYSLAYGRVAGTYCVHVVAESRRKEAGPPEVWETISGEEIPWSSCPREVKLRSFALLPELLEQIAGKGLELAEETAETNATVRDVFAAIGRAGLDLRASSAEVNRTQVAELEVAVPDLMNDLRARLAAEPLALSFAAAKEAAYWPSGPSGQESWRYNEDEMPGVLEALRILAGCGLIAETRSARSAIDGMPPGFSYGPPDYAAYRIAPALAEYLKKSR